MGTNAKGSEKTKCSSHTRAPEQVTGEITTYNPADYKVYDQNDSSD